MVIAARPFKRILGEREETRAARRLGVEASGVHGNGEEHHDKAEKAVASSTRDRSFIRRFRGAGVGYSPSSLLPAAAACRSSRSTRARSIDRIAAAAARGSRDHRGTAGRPRRSVRDRGRRLACDVIAHHKRLLGWGRDARARHARARPVARPRARLRPSAKDRRTLGSRGQPGRRDGGGLFGARFRFGPTSSGPTRSRARVRPAAPRTGCEAPRRS